MTQQIELNEKATKRLFIGVPIEGVEAAALSRAFEMYRVDIQSDFPEGQMRPVPAQNYHITLRFLGNCTESQASQLKAEIQSWAPKCQVPIQLEVASFGVLPFENERQARVPKHFVAFIRPNQVLERLYERVSQLLQRLGVTGVRWDKDFLPHITLAHLKGGEALCDWHLPVGAGCLKIHAHQVCLFESHLRPYGAFYQPLTCVRINELESHCGWR